MFGGNNLEKIKKHGEKGKSSKILPYLKSKKPAERAAAAAALGSALDDDSYNALISHLHDPDVTVCINAAGALLKIGRKTAVDHLRYTANNASDAALKKACNDAAAALVQSGTQ